MFETTTTQAMRTDHARQTAEAEAYGWMMPARVTWRARLAARFRHPVRGATVHQLPARTRPTAAQRAA